jgi:Protein of unknown function (DUF2752)
MASVTLTLVRADRDVRLRNLVLLVGLVAWMAYTRFFWPAQAIHATLPACPFLTLTGHPCPFCGGTRSFAYMWQGSLSHSAALYPLGPLMFVGTLIAIPVLFAAVVTDRTLEWRFAPSLRKVLYVAGCLPLAVSWSLKLTVLPN